MDWLETLWNWLKNSDNQKTLGWIGGLVAAIVAWVIKFYRDHFARQPQPSEPSVPVTEAPAPEAAPPLPPQVDPAERRQTYLRLMIGDWRALPLEVLDPGAAEAAARRLTLEQVYVSLNTSSPRSEKHRSPVPESGRKTLSAVEALFHAERQRMVLLGQPGSGKSTFGRYLGLTLAKTLLEPGVHPLAETLPGWNGPALIPVFLPLRQFAAGLTNLTGPGSVKQVEDFLCRRIEERASLSGFGPALLRELRDPGAMVIFDGLDEVTGEQRLRVKQAISEFAELYPRCRVMLSCRVHSYRQDPAWQLPWESHGLADFDSDQIHRFLTAWYDGLARLNPASPLDYRAKARTLKGALDPDDPRGLRELAGIPLLLTIMAIVHTHKELPDSRVGVYRECVDILLMRWQAAREGEAQRIPLLNALLPYGVTVQKIHQGLKEIAYKAHQNGDQVRQGSGGRALVSDDIINGVMRRWLGAEGLEVFLDYCRHTNGLLLTERVVEQAEGVTQPLYVFPHLSFEEYLAALYWLQQQDMGLKEAVSRAGDPAWWEVARFYGEYLCHDEQGANRIQAQALLARLCPSDSPQDDPGWRRAWLAGALLPGWRKEIPEEDRDPELPQRITQRLVELMQTQAALRLDQPARAAVGRVLANLGDPRPGVGVRDGLPDLLWARIPGTQAVRDSGQFPGFSGLRLGDGENWPAGAKPLELADFELAVYPLTVAQYRPFVQEGGYREDRWWTEAGRGARRERTQPYLWDDPTWTLDNHPVMGVTWYEAEAYCNWLSHRLGLRRGAIRLPTEAEWEWAARGPEGRPYPWGDNWESWRANGQESGIGRTSAVGAFPGGKADWWRVLDPESAEVQDLAGTVWEWTASRYSKDYQYAHRSLLNAGRAGDSPRVVRGGGWGSVPEGLRSAFRGGDATGDADFDLGFRLARTISI